MLRTAIAVLVSFSLFVEVCAPQLNRIPAGHELAAPAQPEVVALVKTDGPTLAVDTRQWSDLQAPRRSRTNHAVEPPAILAITFRGENLLLPIRRMYRRQVHGGSDDLPA